MRRERRVSPIGESAIENQAAAGVLSGAGAAGLGAERGKADAAAGAGAAAGASDPAGVAGAR